MTTESNRFLPALAVRTVGVWILAGALFKLLAGTPADLPPIVREVPLALPLVYKLVIAIEFAIVLGAFLRPRLAWPIVVLTLLVFDAILVTQLAAGSASCGCFGSNVSVPPWAMLAIDTVLLIFVLASKPWSGLRGRGAPLVLVALLIAGTGALPWIFDRQVTAPVRSGSAVASKPADPTTTRAAPVSVADEAKAKGWAELPIEEWIGTSLLESELGAWLPEGTIEQTMPDATWIFYRQSCDHCAEHLADIALADDGSKFYALVQIPDDLDQSTAVQIKPAGDHVLETSLPEGIVFALTTPADFEVVGYEVVAAREPIPHEEH